MGAVILLEVNPQIIGTNTILQNTQILFIIIFFIFDLISRSLTYHKLLTINKIISTNPV